MHRKYKNKLLESPPIKYDPEFPCDSRGGLRLAMSCRFQGLEAKKREVYHLKIYIIFHSRILIDLTSDRHISVRVRKRNFILFFRWYTSRFWLLGHRIYNFQRNGDHHENHKEILDQT